MRRRQRGSRGVHQRNGDTSAGEGPDVPTGTSAAAADSAGLTDAVSRAVDADTDAFVAAGAGPGLIHGWRSGSVVWTDSGWRFCGHYGETSGVEAAAECKCEGMKAHRVAGQGGRCGFYVVRNRPRGSLSGQGIEMEVEGWGRVSEFTGGWRVQYLRVLAVKVGPPAQPVCMMFGPGDSPYPCGLEARYKRTYQPVYECGYHVVSGRHHVHEIPLPILWPQEQLDEWRRDLPTDWQVVDG